MYTSGYKISSDGTLESAVPESYATVPYIDVSDLTDTFIFAFGDAVGSSLRIAQYDENQVSLSDNFAVTGMAQTGDGIVIVKLENCKYIRIFSGVTGPTTGQLKSLSEDITSIPSTSFTLGKKLMPDGSVANESGALTSEEYMDASNLTEEFVIRYPGKSDGASRGAMRIAQYDSNKTSLSSSFKLCDPSEINAEHLSWVWKKLDGCQYIRIFLSGSFGELDGELINIEN